MTASKRMPTIDLRRRVALVTGAAGGIGLGIASALASAGAVVAVNDRDPDAARRVAEQIGGGAFPVPGDVSDESSAEAIVAAAHAPRESLDILVNNAGLAEDLAPLERQQTADWQRVIDVNLRGPYLMSRAAAARLRASPAGVIINVSSVAGLVAFPGSHAYGVSKAGLAMMTKTLAGELARHGVRVNAVAPGVIEAPMLDRMTKDGARLQSIVSRVPLGRLGRVEEVGAAVAFLCSDLAAYVTGAVLPVDGGWTAFGGAGVASRSGSEPGADQPSKERSRSASAGVAGL